MVVFPLGLVLVLLVAAGTDPDATHFAGIPRIPGQIQVKRSEDPADKGDKASAGGIW